MKSGLMFKWGLGLGLAALPLVGCSHEQGTPPSVQTGAAVTTEPQAVALAEPAVPPEAGLSQPPSLEELAAAPATAVGAPKPLPSGIPSAGPVAEVIKLANAGATEGVLLSYVTNSSSTFNLAADQIIYLNDIGVPSSVITAMIQRDEAIKTTSANAALAAAAAAASNAAPPPPPALAPGDVAPQPAPSAAAYPTEPPPSPPPVGDTSYEGFYDSLSPYGTWIDVEGYGRCWQPTVVVINPTWQPYFDCGHWVYTDCGWYWSSDYSWGWAPFHYGRWFRHNHWGWCWAPDRVWGPSWVSWRYSADYCGWAPLPPGAWFSFSLGLTWHGRHIHDWEECGLGPHHYHFVSWGHFHERHLHGFGVPPREVNTVYKNTVVVNNIVVNNNTVMNRGIAPERVSAATHQAVTKVTIRDDFSRTGPLGRSERFDKKSGTLTVYRPPLQRPVSTSSAAVTKSTGAGPGPAASQLSPIRSPRASETASRTTAPPVREPAVAKHESGPLPSAQNNTTPVRGHPSVTVIGRNPNANPAPGATGTQVVEIPRSGRTASSESSATPSTFTPGKASTPAVTRSSPTVTRSSPAMAREIPSASSRQPTRSAPATIPPSSSSASARVGTSPAITRSPAPSTATPWQNRVGTPSVNTHQSSMPSYQAPTRTPTAPAPSYTPSRSYSPPSAPSYAPSRSYTAPSAPAPSRSYTPPPAPSVSRSPSFESRPAPAPSRSVEAPRSAPSGGGGSPARSDSGGSRSSNSGGGGRGR